MAKVSFQDPVANVNGRIDNNSETYFCTRFGQKVVSHYPKHKNPKKISSRQRTLNANFTHAVQQARIELADPDRRAFWLKAFERQMQTADKPYRILRNFVIAELTKQDTSN
ncbi:MAG: hypothetical protein ACI30J_09920 [Paludibacteraceae bacterium]